MKKKIIFIIIMFFTIIGTCYAEEYPEEIQQKLEAEFNEMYPNNTLTLNSYIPNTRTEFDSILKVKAKEIGNINELYFIGRIQNCNSNFTECDAKTIIYNQPENYTYTKKIKIQYTELNPKISKKINKLIDNYKTKYADKTYGQYTLKDIRISDLDLINYFYYTYNEGDDPTHTEAEEGRSINFITELKDDFDNSNLTYKFIPNGCDINVQLFSDSHTSGILFLYYGETIYGGLEVDLGYNNIIYVPSNTLKDENSTLEAAKKRIKKYFGQDFEMQVSRKTEVDNGEMGWAVGGGDITRFGDIDTMSENIYKLKINGIEYEFLIIRDSKKMIKENYKTKDIRNDISVTLTDDSIPFDTLITSENIENNEEYKKIIGKENVHTYDINLHSKTLNTNIRKTERGTFIVSIPVPEDLKEKNIVAYYINNKNELEKHEVKIENGYAIFETNHFSVYSLSEPINVQNNTINVPNTSDNITTSFIILFISIINIIGITFIYKKAN